VSLRPGGFFNYDLSMEKYVDSTEQLVIEILVKDLRRAINFYSKLGFKLLRETKDFAEITWEDHRLFLAEPSAFHDATPSKHLPEPGSPIANIRVMVPNVDDYWKLVNEMGATIILPIGDRYYGLRDFTIADPDGFGVRFASSLE
jgi:catechol 2,3-dioxygenase-like lactoylglutathione lyase family enzyme